MREAKAHFDEATPTTSLAESDSASSAGSETTTSSSSSSNSLPVLENATSASNSADTDTIGSASPPMGVTDSPPCTSTQTDSAGGVLHAKRTPQTALAAAHKATKQPGSSTALVLHLTEGSNTLKASNLVSVQACIPHGAPPRAGVVVSIVLCIGYRKSMHQ